MNQKQKNEENEIEIDIGRLFRAVADKAWLVALTSVISALLAFLITFTFVTPMYQSSAMFYVNNSAFSLGAASLSISSGDLTTSRGLVDSYIVILNTRETLAEVLEYAGSSRSFSELKNMIEGEITDEEISQTKLTIINSLKANYDGLHGLEAWYLNEAIRGTAFTPEMVMERVENVTADDIRNVLSLLNLNVVYTISK